MAQIRHFYPELTIIADNMGMEAGDNLIEVQRDSIKNTERDFDPAVYTAARIFNAVALPDEMPDFLKDAIEAKAEQAKISAQEAGFVAPDMGRSYDGKTIQERERDKEEESRLYVASVFQEVEERRAREREEWSRTSSTVAGVTMTGAEWAKLAERLRNDDDLRKRVIEAFERRGMSRDEAGSRYERAAEVAEAAAIPLSQRNEDQKRAIKSAEADPTFKQDKREIDTVISGQDMPATANKAELANAFTAATENAPQPSQVSASPISKPFTQTIGMGL